MEVTGGKAGAVIFSGDFTGPYILYVEYGAHGTSYDVRATAT